MLPRLRAAALVFALALAAGSNVTAARPASAATDLAALRHVAGAAGHIADPVVGPDARDEARHAQDKLSFHPASSPIIPLRQATAGNAGPRLGASASAPPNLLAATPGHVQREVLGFAPYWGLSDAPNWNYSLVSTVAYFGLDMNQYGGFEVSGSGWAGWNSQEFTTMVNLAHSHGDRVVVVIKQFNSAKINSIVTSETYRQTAAGATVNMIRSKGLDGVNVDFEGDPGCPPTVVSESQCVYPDMQAGITTFMTELSSWVHSQLPNQMVSMDTYSGSASWDLGIFKIGDLAPAVDAFFIMAYDMAFSNMPAGHAGPNAPMAGWEFGDISAVAQYLTKAPASKIILGVPYYGYKYCTVDSAPYTSITRNVYGTILCPDGSDAVVAEAYPAAQADVACGNQQLRLIWDITALSAFASWYSPAANDPCGVNHNSWRELYWDNAQSLGVKYDLVNKNNLRGAGIWTLDYGGGAPELWNELAVKFAYIPSAPGNVAAYSQDSAATVSWSPSESVGGPILNYTVLASPGGATTTVSGSTQSTIVHGLTNGTSYTFTVKASNTYGAGIVSAASNAIVPGTPAMAWYFPWYDFATPGIQSDYFAVANPGPAWSNVVIQLPGAVPLSFGVPHGTAKYVSFPHGSSGGPVLITTDGEPVVVSQRVVFNQSASETAATPAAGLGTTLVWPWYDWTTPGFQSDYFYIGNPSAAAANVTISMPGATSLHLTVAAGGGGFTTFPHGSSGGAVTLNSDQPVLATQRVVWGDSFTDIPARLPSSEGTSLVWPVYYWASSDFGSDYFYVANLGANPAHVTISVPGATPITATVAPGTATFRTFPYGTAGGPVTLSSDQPVLASQRILFDQSAMETPASLAASAAISFHFPWYEWSGSDLQSVYFYVANPGPAWSNILISMPGAPLLSFGVPRGTTKAVAWPRSTGGGPVTVTTDGQPVFISQRTVFDQSAYEFTAPPGS